MCLFHILRNEFIFCRTETESKHKQNVKSQSRNELCVPTCEVCGCSMQNAGGMCSTRILLFKAAGVAGARHLSVLVIIKLYFAGRYFVDYV